MFTSADRLANCLLEEGEKAVAAFRRLAPEDWQCPVCTDGACWTAHELLAHFVSAEAGKLALLEDIVAGGQGAPEGCDTAPHSARDLAALPVADLLRQFVEARRASVQLVGCMHAGDLARTVRDPILGDVAVEEIVTLTYRHNQTHLRELRAALGSSTTCDAHEPAL